MAVKIKNTGYTNGATPSLPRFGSRQAVLMTTNGTKVVVLADANDSASSTYGDNSNVSKLYFYENDVSTQSIWTLRLTINLATTLAKSVIYAAEIFSNNDIGVVYKLSTGALAYRKITYATWASAAEETVRANAANTTVAAVDICISQTGVPIVGVNRTATIANNENVVEVYVRRTSDNTWQRPIQTVTLVGTASSQNQDVSLDSVEDLGSATNRGLVIATSCGLTSGPDGGAQIRSAAINETTGALVNGPTLRATLTPDAVAGSNTVTGPPRRVYVQSRQFGGVGEVNIGIACARTSPGSQPGKSLFAVARYRWNPATTTWANPIPVSTFVGPTDLSPSQGMAFHGSYDIIGFFVSSKFVTRTGVTVNGIHLIGGRFDTSIPGATWFNAHLWTNQTAYQEVIPFSLSKANNGLKRISATYLVQRSNTQFELWDEKRKDIPVQASVPIPAPGSTVTTSTPAVAADADLDQKYPQYPVRAFWNFAKDPGMTTGLVQYFQPDSKYVDVVGTDASGVVRRINDVLPIASLLTQGVWYATVGLAGPWGGNPVTTGTPISFTVSHPPAPANLTPTADVYLLYGSSGTTTFKWDFTDSSPEDYQTAYQILVERVSDGTTVWDSGKVTAGSPSIRQASNNISATYKDAQLRWKIRLWDRDDVAGAYSDYQTFYIVDPPSLSVSSPTVDQVLTTGVPPISFTVTVGASRTLKSYKVNFWQGSSVIHSSGVVVAAPGLTGAIPITYTPPLPILRNNQYYTVEVIAEDSIGLLSNLVQVPVSTSFVLPAAVTGVVADASTYNTEGLGYVTVTWNDAARDVDFVYWNVYRRQNELGSTGSVVETLDWELVGTSYDTFGSTHSLLDSNAPSGGKVEYKVTQVVNRFGDLVEGPDSNIPFVNPVTEGYWLLSTDQSDAFQLSIVVSDDYSDEYEEEEYIIFGRGRHVDRGQHLGLKGTLVCQLRNTGSTTARQKKRRLENMKENNTVLFLRTPFGDVYRVSASNLSVTRIAGVANNEFCDVTIPYSEVAE